MYFELRIWRFRIKFASEFLEKDEELAPPPMYSPTVGYMMSSPDWAPDDVDAHLPIGFTKV